MSGCLAPCHWFIRESNMFLFNNIRVQSSSVCQITVCKLRCTNPKKCRRAGNPNLENVVLELDISELFYYKSHVHTQN